MLIPDENSRMNREGDPEMYNKVRPLRIGATLSKLPEESWGYCNKSSTAYRGSTNLVVFGRGSYPLTLNSAGGEEPAKKYS